MCDTLVALGQYTANGDVLFAKNSDREPNEAHHILYVPAARHVLGDQVNCTYLTIPQVEETYAVLLAKPFWIWGAEMGTNEYGVTIGNEAVFTKVGYSKAPGMIGMDFLRLALERSRTAESALHTMIQLLEVYGQSGNCGFAHKLYYDNSYIIADTKEAWVLETAGRQWAAQKVQNVRSISNHLTIEDDWDLASDDLVPYAKDRGWYKKGEKFSFRRCYSDFLYSKFADGKRRQACTTEALMGKMGSLTAADMMHFLRSHGEGEATPYRIDQGVTGSVVCMHAGLGPVRGSQTVGSMVSELRSDSLSTHWVTGTAAPCTGIFKPLWLDAVPEFGKIPEGKFDSRSMFWQHEQLHREVLWAYDDRLAVYEDDRNQLESGFITKSVELLQADAIQRKAFSNQCLSESRAATEAWLARVRKVPAAKLHAYHKLAWKKFNRQADFPQI